MEDRPKKIEDFLKPSWAVEFDYSKHPSKLYGLGTQNAELGDRYCLEVAEVDSAAGIIRFNLVKI